jgi:hypothetical protein
MAAVGVRIFLSFYDDDNEWKNSNGFDVFREVISVHFVTHTQFYVVLAMVRISA